METIPAQPRVVQEDYPLWVTVLAWGFTVVSWGTGALIFYLISLNAAIVYLLLCVAVMALSTNLRCRFCIYYGRRCSSGLGLISARLFSRGDASGFCDKRNIMPVLVASFAVLLLPLAAGALWTLLEFSWSMAGLTAFYLIVVVGGGFVVQGNVYCKRCAQGRAGCPAYQGMKGNRQK